MAWLALAGQGAAAPAGAEPEADAPAAPLSADALQTLVAPVALYPDDLLALVLPASTYPLQVVQAARFLKARKKDKAIEPGADWNDAIIALLNYPEAVELLNDDLDWTWQLGQAVLAQEQDVIAAVSAFREKAKSAGNLASDSKQKVAVEDGAIRIQSTSPTRIHVPYYEPAEVVAHQPYRVYHYYPRAYPVYYYPYHRHHHFRDGLFWGVTSAFSVGWRTGRLHWHHHGFHDHPYFGRRYYDPFYYRRPHLHLSLRERNHQRRGERHHHDNRWHPGDRRGGARPSTPQHRGRWAGEWRRTLAQDRDRPENRRRRAPPAEDQGLSNPLVADRRMPGNQNAVPEDTAAPALRPISRTVRPAAGASDNGSRTLIHAPTQARLLPRGSVQRPQPLGRGGGAGKAWQRPASAAAQRAAPPGQRERPLSQATRNQAQPVPSGLPRQPAQVRRQPSAADRPVAQAAAPQGRWTPGAFNAIPRPQRPVQPKAQPAPRPNQTWQVRPEAGALSPEALSKQIQRQPPPQARRTRKEVNHR